MAALRGWAGKRTRPTPLVSAEELLEAPESVVFIDARGGEGALARYSAGHLAGAHFADLEVQLSAPGDAARGGRHPLPEAHRFAQIVGRWGITPASDVIVYDEAGGANAAARAWWMIRALGHERVSVLDGGFAAAVAAGLPLSRGRLTEVDAPPYPADSYGLGLASIDEVDVARTSDDRRVIDARAVDRYRGKTEPIDPVAGHIPGARNLFHGAHLDAAGRFRPASEVRAQLESVLDGVSSDRAIVYCGSGVTACQSLLAMAHAGLPLASLYVGSWSEWCRSDRPRAAGEETE